MRSRALSHRVTRSCELKLDDTEGLSLLYRKHKVLEAKYLDDRVAVTYIE